MSTTVHSPEQEPAVAETQRLVPPGSRELLERLRTENDQLRTALATRIVIEQAKGMLAERFDLDVDDAFERLRREARNRRMKLHALVAAVIAREAWTETTFPAGEPRNAAARRSLTENVEGPVVVRSAQEGER
jgi:hypothetical protein